MPTPTATIFLPYHALDAVIQRGPRAAQPDAADVVPGTLYSVTDEGNRVEQSTGQAWAVYSPTGGGGEGGAPDPHAPTHAAQGSDALSVTALAGYPGGGSTFLRDDGTFAAAAGPAGPEGPPGPPGDEGPQGPAGADAAIVADAQYWVSTPHATLSAERNLGALASGYVKATTSAGVATPSTVTTIPTADGGTGVTTGLTVLNADNLASGTVPAARLTAANLPAHASRHNAGGADAMAVDAIPTTGSLRTLGTGANQAAPGNDTRFTAAPQAHHASHEPGGADALANAAWTNQANAFSQNQLISKVFPRLAFRNTSAIAGQQRVGLGVATSGGYFLIETEDDIGTSGFPMLTVSRAGDVQATKDVYEKGRATPMGHWTDIGFSAGNFAASGGGVWTVSAQTVYAYMLIGKTLWLSVYLANTTITGTPPALVVALPGGMTNARPLGTSFALFQGGVASTGWALGGAGQTGVTLHRDILGTAFAAGTCHLSGTFVLNIN